jgi:lysosomal Pro-X carboxypeptidase
MPKSFVLTVGGSYAGELAAWMRMKYPDVVNGALSSSAPLFYRMNLQNLVSNNSYE